jgi:hypothetical protein
LSGIQQVLQSDWFIAVGAAAAGANTAGEEVADLASLLADVALPAALVCSVRKVTVEAPSTLTVLPAVATRGLEPLPLIGLGPLHVLDRYPAPARSVAACHKASQAV